jgi:hypothetical protein
LIARSAIVVLLAGCAALSETECTSMNWRQRGYDDGYFGHPPQDLRLAAECSRFGIKASESQYLEGWRAGYDEWDRLMGSIGVD